MQRVDGGQCVCVFAVGVCEYRGDPGHAQPGVQAA